MHPGAIYLHMGAAFEVEELDLEQRRALVRPFNGDWYTQPKKESETWIEQVRDQRRESCGVALTFGRRTRRTTRCSICSRWTCRSRSS